MSFSSSKSRQRSFTTNTTTSKNLAASDEAQVVEGTGNQISRVTRIETLDADVASDAFDTVKDVARTSVVEAGDNLDRSLEFGERVNRRNLDTVDRAVDLTQDTLQSGQRGLTEQRELVGDLARRTLASPQPDSQIANNLLRLGIPAVAILLGVFFVTNSRK